MEQDITQETFNSIERYLLREMTAPEQEAFAARLKQEPLLQAQVQEIRLLFLGIEEAALQEQLNEFHRGLPASVAETAPTPRRTFPMMWRIAASAILLIGAAFVWWLLSQSNSPEKLYAEYYHPDPGLMTAMSSSDNYLFDRAMIDYKTGEYATALEAWQSLQQTRPNSDTLNYFIGSAWLALDNADKAVAALEKVIESPNSVFRQEAYWYLGLALLKEGKTEEAIPYLEKSDRPEKEEILPKLRE